MHSLKITTFFFCLCTTAGDAVGVRADHWSPNPQQEDSQVRCQLDTAQTIFEGEFKIRQEYRVAFADTAANDFALKQALQEEIRSFLAAPNNHRARINADITMSIAADGALSAQVNTAGFEVHLLLGGHQPARKKYAGNSCRFQCTIVLNISPELVSAPLYPQLLTFNLLRWYHRSITDFFCKVWLYSFVMRG